MWTMDAQGTIRLMFDMMNAYNRADFHRVPEPKVGKNRLHLDLDVARDVPPEQYRQRIGGEAERLRQLGATRLRAVEEHGEYWVTMLDPEGYEFDLM
jgi:hypothetical protein